MEDSQAKRFFITLFTIVLCVPFTAGAQSYLNHLQAKGGKATVTVTQSQQLDSLVDNVKARQAETSSAEATSPKANTPVQGAAQPKSPATRKEVASSTDDLGDEMEIPTVDLRKKVMRQSYRVNGYRVQVFWGGNSRSDKLKAQSIGDKLKMSFPDEPVYVHFYSPRWICRMGNYRSLQEANNILKQIKKMGYKQACVVRGKITVQY